MGCYYARVAVLRGDPSQLSGPLSAIHTTPKYVHPVEIVTRPSVGSGIARAVASSAASVVVVVVVMEVVVA